MVLLSGTLQKSRSLVHSVLRCELGVFSVCDERLNTVSAGRYEGLFEIEAIQPHCLPSNDGTVQWGMVAILKRFSLSVVDVNQRSAVSKPQQLPTQPAQMSLFKEEEKSDSLEQASSAPWVSTAVTPASTQGALDAAESTAAIVPSEFSIHEREDADGDSAAIAEPVGGGCTIGIDEDTALFGEGHVFSETIALDVTEPRAVLRRQRERLKALGYRFDAAQQVWRRAPVSDSES